VSQNEHKLNINAPVDTSVEREKHGFDVLKDDTIKCADCRRKLIDIIQVKEDEGIIKEIQVQCYCGGSSFIYEIKGHTFMQAAKGVAIVDMPTRVVGNITYITIEVIKT